MRTFDTNFEAALVAAPDQGVKPSKFFWIVARDRDTGVDVPKGFWAGDETLTLSVTPPGSGSSSSREFVGQVGLSIEPLAFVTGLDDRSFTLEMDYTHPAIYELVRTYDIRHAYCEVYSGLSAGNRLVSNPELEIVGVVDEAPIEQPAVGGTGSQKFIIRDQLLTQLGMINPAKSSDQHQQRRLVGDRFSEYSGTVAMRTLTWYVPKT